MLREVREDDLPVFFEHQATGPPGRASTPTSDAVMELIARGIVRGDFHVMAEVDSVHALMKKFATVPMSLSDACVIRMTDPRQRLQGLPPKQAPSRSHTDAQLNGCPPKG